MPVCQDSTHRSAAACEIQHRRIRSIYKLVRCRRINPALPAAACQIASSNPSCTCNAAQERPRQIGSMRGCYTGRGSGRFVVRQPACRVARAREAPAANMGVVGSISNYAASTQESIPIGAAKDHMVLWFRRYFF